MNTNPAVVPVGYMEVVDAPKEELILDNPEAVRALFSRDHCIAISEEAPYAWTEQIYLQFRWERRPVTVKGHKAVETAKRLYRCSVGRIG